ncbi:anti-sigma factor domain-containing protein [Bacillus albus]|uniref:anti-sigma-I factor RsgI family protein n=1 Tax=Bacillus cereus group TaxID=86661 RepID=UPI0022E69C41|nr:MULTISPECIES: anti-sigma factor domain-containing protein [Bacillus cereus group]MDA2026952.1 anti-sigma factor domain-containing protein [Bacillus cereus group sp. Bcc03]MDA2217165.1 anti-sigma factor domain-containing protein [Bacillus cereus group sp. Bc228]MDA2228451.1 anti-sigma factor domain-containing protein [Bacillus cereus group sp. Bc227]MDA2261558.1 anti-sigma factor domain-containing protein [Bacillus cereus group sp. Bc200]MDA2322256.1 anti-sigma factor domain-containing prote
MMNKGIVMDIKKHSIVVLTPNGEFITCKRKGDSCVIGEEISFEEQEQRASRFSIPYFLKPASLLIACFLCALLFFYNQPEEKVFAYVSVDINPSLEVSVTKDLRVIDLQACNDDGRRILKELKQWENKQLQEVIRTIIKQSQEDKYLTNDKQVMLTAVAKDKSLEPKLEKAMKELKKEYELKHITVEYQSSTMQVREDARKAGIGTGVYIKQENEKNKSLTPPATPSNQVENEEEVQSQPESSPDVSPDLSPVKEKKYEKPEHKEQKETEEQPSRQIKENNGQQQGNNGRGSQQENRGSQQGNNGNEQGNNGRGPQQGNNGNEQGNNGRGPQQGNNGNQQGNNGRGPQQGNNGNEQGNNGRGSQQGNSGNEQGNNGRGSQQENNGNEQGNNGRGSQKENNGSEQGNNGRGSQQENRGHQQGNEKKNQ